MLQTYVDGMVQHSDRHVGHDEGEVPVVVRCHSHESGARGPTYSAYVRSLRPLYGVSTGLSNVTSVDQGLPLVPSLFYPAGAKAGACCLLIHADASLSL